MPAGSPRSPSTEAEALEEVEAEILEDTDAGTDSESSLIAPGRDFRPSFIGRQSFSVKMYVAASQPQKSEWELRGLLMPMEARADRSEADRMVYQAPVDRKTCVGRTGNFSVRYFSVVARDITRPEVAVA